MTRADIICKLESKYDETVVEKLDMWYVAYVRIDAFGQFDFHYAYFHSRYDAEVWFSSRTDGETFYGYCCGEAQWNNMDDFLTYVED